MGRNTNVPFSTFISARLPSLTLRASATAFGMRTARLLPHLQNSTIMASLHHPHVDTMYILELRLASGSSANIDQRVGDPGVRYAGTAADDLAFGRFEPRLIK